MLKYSLIALIAAMGISAAQAAIPQRGGASASGSAVVLSRHGADDPAGDDRGGKGKDDGAGHTRLVPLSNSLMARHGADDPAGDDRGGKGKDDGAGHTWNEVPSTLQFARHGADDPAGDDRGGKGNDDGAGHT